eukprot:277185_1
MERFEDIDLNLASVFNTHGRTIKNQIASEETQVIQFKTNNGNLNILNNLVFAAEWNDFKRIKKTFISQKMRRTNQPPLTASMNTIAMHENKSNVPVRSKDRTIYSLAAYGQVAKEIHNISELALGIRPQVTQSCEILVQKTEEDYRFFYPTKETFKGCVAIGILAMNKTDIAINLDKEFQEMNTEFEAKSLYMINGIDHSFRIGQTRSKEYEVNNKSLTEIIVFGFKHHPILDTIFDKEHTTKDR